ncbi:MAG: Hsp20/alpha crystallin family protein [Roseiflexaceae bacterium]|nr:Hsp20/alpha crystallin family protein [Roseiflexaceae bacterium]
MAPRRNIPPSTAEQGFGGLLKGLGELVERISALSEQDGINQNGSFTIKGLGERAQGVYGVSIRSGIGGVPQVEHFGNLRATATGPEVAEAREPLLDLFDEDGELVVVVELPGVDEADIRVTLRGAVLALETIGARRFSRELALPGEVEQVFVQQYHNGILEIRLRKVAS